jgi:hypothetical protein
VGGPIARSKRIGLGNGQVAAAHGWRFVAENALEGRCCRRYAVTGRFPQRVADPGRGIHGMLEPGTRVVRVGSRFAAADRPCSVLSRDDLKTQGNEAAVKAVAEKESVLWRKKQHRRLCTRPQPGCAGIRADRCRVCRLRKE